MSEDADERLMQPERFAAERRFAAEGTLSRHWRRTARMPPRLSAMVRYLPHPSGTPSPGAFDCCPHARQHVSQCQFREFLRHQRSSTEPGPSLVTGLAQIQHLGHLELLAINEGHLPDGLRAFLLSMKKLRSLFLTFTNSPEVTIKFAHVVRSLTMLTSLSFMAHCISFIIPPFDPITELQRLRELAVNHEVMWIENRTPRFLRMPYLTSLESASF